MMSFSLNFKNEFEESKKYLHVPIQFSTGFFVTNDLSIGSTETKYIKLKPKIFLLCKWKFDDFYIHSDRGNKKTEGEKSFLL